MTRHQTTHYFQLPETDLPALERIITLAGFKNKTAYFTACAKATVYGSPAESAENTLDPVTRSWIDRIRQHAGRRETLMHTLIGVIRTLAYPVLAMKGELLTWQTLRDDIREQCYTQSRQLATDQEIKEALDTFALLNRDELADYRSAQLAEQYFAGGV